MKILCSSYTYNIFPTFITLYMCQLFEVSDSGNIYFLNNGHRQESRHVNLFIFFVKSPQYLTTKGKPMGNHNKKNHSQPFQFCQVPVLDRQMEPTD